MHPSEEDAFLLSVEKRKVELLESIAAAVGADVESKVRCPNCSLFVSDLETHDCPGSRRSYRLLQNPDELAAYRGEASESDESEADSQAEQAEQDEQDAGEVDPPFDPTEMLVSDLREQLDDSDYSDDELVALLAAERDGDNRSTATDAIESEMEE